MSTTETRVKMEQVAGNDFAYIGVKDGTVRAIVFDDPMYPRDTAKLVAEWIRMGRTVERVIAADGIDRMKREHKAKGQT